MEIPHNYPLLFVNTFMYAYVILFPGNLSVVFIILIESINKINRFWEGCTGITFLFFSSLADRNKYCETPKHSEQNFRDQELGTKVNIFYFSVFEAMTRFSCIEAVTNFSFMAARSLSSSSALFLVSLSNIGW